MSTPFVPTTKPDRPARDADADLVVDIPQLSVDELALELESSLVLKRVKLDAKGLQVGVYLNADLDLVRLLVEQRSGRSEGGGSRWQRGPDVDRVRTGLRELLSGARETEPRPAEAEQAHERGEQEGHDGNGARPHAARHAAAQGAMAAGLTAAGLAGGALLEARAKPSRKLHIPRRRSRAQVIRVELVKRLP